MPSTALARAVTRTLTRPGMSRTCRPTVTTACTTEHSQRSNSAPLAAAITAARASPSVPAPAPPSAPSVPAVAPPSAPSVPAAPASAPSVPAAGPPSAVAWVGEKLSGVRTAKAARSAAVCAAALAAANAPMSTASTPAASTKPASATPTRVAPPRSCAAHDRAWGIHPASVTGSPLHAWGQATGPVPADLRRPAGGARADREAADGGAKPRSSLPVMS
jgi:hypothetical protein